MGSRLGLALLVPLLLGAATPEPGVTPAEIKDFAGGSPAYRSYPDPLVVGWEADLRAALKTAGPDQAAQALAPKYGLSPANARELVQLTILIGYHRYRSPKPPIVADARRRLLALLGASGRAPLVLGIAAGGLDDLGDSGDMGGASDCPAADFDALMAGSTDRAADAWRITENATCGDNFLRFAAADPARAMPGLIRLANYGSLDARLALPLYAWLTSDAALAHIAAPDRPVLSALLYQRYLGLLFDAGLTDRAVALFEGLPAATRALILDPAPANFTATVDGLPLRIKEDRASDAMQLNLAAAYAVAGRTAQAEALFAAAPAVPLVRSAFACSWKDQPDQGSRCKYDWQLKMDWAVLDHWLHHPSDDPYPLAEVIFAGTSSNSDSGPLADLHCKVFTEASLHDICETAGHIVASNASLTPEASEVAENARNEAALTALALPGFATNRAAIADAFRQVHARYDYVETPRSYRRERVASTPSPFEHPLPAQYRGARPPPAAWPAAMAPLPEGFDPIRFERSGNRAVAVSISQNYDPTGEISRGGYWVHLSDDAGKSWRGYYTGLADHFPYVVFSASKLPLIAGDALDLEVEIAELDTSSITYPPVGLRTTRRVPNLYLHIPLAELTRDSDSDGITDIAAHHLLLDQARTDGGTPFVVGTTPAAQCAAAPSADRLALTALLEKLFSVKSAGLIEPIDRPPGVITGAWGKAAESRDRPILIKGDARDYACLRPDRLMIVYGDKDIAQLQLFTPDFRTIELPRIVYNRAHDRGYVRWSTGWSGGTYRMRLVDGSWTFDVISSWIT
ncbi:MAG: hypothetical protein V4574_15790 [Pseudomonadota bacterium]